MTCRCRRVRHKSARHERVKAEQQRADPVPAAFGIAPPDHDKFLGVEAFRLGPGTAVGLVAPIRAFRDDPFETAAASEFIEGRPLPCLVVAVAQRRRYAGQQRFELCLALDKRPRTEIVAIEKQQIKSEKYQRSVAGALSRVMSQMQAAPGILISGGADRGLPLRVRLGSKGPQRRS